MHKVWEDLIQHINAKLPEAALPPIQHMDKMKALKVRVSIDFGGDVSDNLVMMGFAELHQDGSLIVTNVRSFTNE